MKSDVRVDFTDTGVYIDHIESSLESFDASSHLLPDDLIHYIVGFVNTHGFAPPIVMTVNINHVKDDNK